jgi:hypothetical protein
MSNSDYNKPRTDLFKLLPAVLQTKVNQSITDNVCNRFLTKSELVPATGSIGKRSPSVVSDDRLHEPTVSRQAWQLQPLLYTKIATAEHIADYNDILSKAERLGIDISRLPKWGNSLKFNFIPPINIDKLINYQDYYWYDVVDPSSPPQYITIQSMCNVAENRLYQTSVQLAAVLADPTSTPADIDDIQQRYNAAYAQTLCACSTSSNGSVGWDNSSWDDNNGNWWSSLPQAPTHTPPDVTQPDNTFVYYDVTTQLVMVWSIDTNSWVPATQPVGTFPWDSSENCNPQTDPWSKQNKWIHKSTINDSLGGLARRATMPIIEYNASIELNEWVQVSYNWKYRANDVSGWVQSSTGPTDAESIIRYKISSIDFINNEIHLQGDLLSVFPVGLVFAVENPITYDNTLLTVTLNGFDGNDTILRIKESVANIDQTYNIAPISTTSIGDKWNGFFYHWVYDGSNQPVPTTNQVINTNLVFSETLSTTTNKTIFEAPNYLYGGDVIRVYVNNIRQFGNYLEGTIINGDISTFTAGSTSVHANAIQFFKDLNVSDTVRIEVSPAALSDDIHGEVLVRTTTSDSFVPETVTLITYRKVEQVKTDTNQYPIFNIYNVDGTPAYRANSIFVFQESSKYPVDARINKRIVIGNYGKEFYFDQQLLDYDNDVLYCYHDSAIADSSNPSGLQSIWRHGINNEQYIPRYVNQYRLADGDQYLDATNTLQTAHVTAGVSDTDYNTTGDWEVADQLFYNANHDNRKLLSLTDLVSHFNTIIAAQQPDNMMNFLLDQGAIVGSLNEYNFGVGGSIKEFNDSFDMFLSAMFQNNTDPIGIIEFAANQYAINTQQLQETFIHDSVTFLKKGMDPSDVRYIWDQQYYISDDIITTFEFNEANDFAFGDTTVYDAKNTVDSFGQKIGIKNWIATLPFLRLSRAVEPIIFTDAALGIRQVRCHDGHIVNIELPTKTVYSIIDRLITATNGLIGTSAPTSNLSPGIYWKNTNDNKLYRFNVVSVAASPPGVINPIGSLWLNTNTNSLYVRDNSNTGWSVYSGPITDAWKVIDINHIVASIVLESEMRLYRAVPTFASFSFDYNMIIEESPVFVDYMKKAYFDYIQQHQLNPFTTDYDITNAFTWNYGGVDTAVVQYPTVISTTNKVWGSRWDAIYKEIYGTQYPHLEPWVLQGYTDKPSWWDITYADTNGTRKWTATMWSNIAGAIIPTGMIPPSVAPKTYTHFCVNIYNNTIDGYAPDSLIPPFYSNDITLTQQSLIRDYNYIPVTKVDSTDVVISSPYAFGDFGPVEQMWRDSTEFMYDIVKIAFKMQPVRFLHYTMGFDFYDVAGLQVEKISKQVLSHKNMVFHGDLVNNTVYQSHGLSQWYTNFVRNSAYDVNSSDFKTLWVTWDPKLTYQTASFINAKSLQLSSKYFPITKQDYTVTTKKTSGFADYWVDSLFVTTHTVGSWNTFNNTKIPVGNGSDWEFRVEISSPVGRDISYYDVKNYDFTIDLATDICTSVQGLPWDDQATNYDHPIGDTNTWNTGTAVFIRSTGSNPKGINDERVYFIIKVSNNTFKLADSATNAEVGLSIDLTDLGIGTLSVCEVRQTFVASGNIVNVSWEHYKYDKRHINTIRTPVVIKGIQKLINFIDGYAEFYRDQGFIFNDTEDITEIDIDTGTPLSWQVEIERLINRIFTGLGAVGQTISYDQPDGGPYVVSGSSNWITRQNNITEYHEVNPFRNNIWFNNKIGVVSNISSGAYDDISQVPLIYDYTGTNILTDNIFIFREDSKCRITLSSLSGSVYDGEDAIPRPYNDFHMSGVHLYVDTFEHIIMFNNYTIDNNLLYDPFIGLNVSKLHIDFEKHTAQTFRPNVGGYFLNDNQLVQNIEYSIDNMKYYYDTYIVNETADYLDYARALLGYENPSYLDELKVNAKSKFVFWKGMLQYKGSVNSINAYVNSKLFVDAKVDEFWAYKVAEYGNVDSSVYPQIKLTMDDVHKHEMRLHFTTSTDLLENTFTPIVFEDESRWVDLPDLKAALEVYRKMIYGWDLPVWDTLTGLEWDSPFPAIENLFFDAEYTSQLTVDTTNDTNIDNNGYIVLPDSCDGVSIICNAEPAVSVYGPEIIYPFVPNMNHVKVFTDIAGTYTELLQGTDYNEYINGIVNITSPLGTSASSVVTVSIWNDNTKHYDILYTLPSYDATSTTPLPLSMLGKYANSARNIQITVDGVVVDDKSLYIVTIENVSIKLVSLGNIRMDIIKQPISLIAGIHYTRVNSYIVKMISLIG